MAITRITLLSLLGLLSLLVVATPALAQSSFDQCWGFFNEERYDQAIEHCQHNFWGDRSSLVVAEKHYLSQEYQESIQRVESVLGDPYSLQIAHEASMLAMEVYYSAGECQELTNLHDYYETQFDRSIHGGHFSNYNNECETYLEQQEEIQGSGNVLVISEDPAAAQQLFSESFGTRTNQIEQSTGYAYAEIDTSCSADQQGLCNCENATLGQKHGFARTVLITDAACRSHAAVKQHVVFSTSNPQIPERFRYHLGIGVYGLLPEFEATNPLTTLQAPNCQQGTSQADTCINGLTPVDEESFMDYPNNIFSNTLFGNNNLMLIQNSFTNQAQ